MFMTSMQVFLFHGNLPALSGLSLLLFPKAVSSRDQLKGKHEIKKKRKKQPSMISPFGRCWGQATTNRTLEINSGVNSISGWFLLILFQTSFQAYNMADHLFGALLFQQQGSSFREHGFMERTTQLSLCRQCFPVKMGAKEQWALTTDNKQLGCFDESGELSGEREQDGCQWDMQRVG